jgi:hypothetical protein
MVRSALPSSLGPVRATARIGLAAAALVAPLSLLPAAAQASPAVPVPVLTDLSNPRGVAIAASGLVYVAEAGSGGDLLLGEGPEGPLYLGRSGQIQAFDPSNGKSRVVVAGLVSAAGPDGSFALGVAGLSASGSTVYAIMDESSSAIPPVATEPLAEAARAQLGRLYKVTPSGHMREVADVGGFDYAWSADHLADPPDNVQDANPYGVLATPSKVLVADAGSNSITEVTHRGALSAALVPTVGGMFLSDAVPTCVAPAGRPSGDGRADRQGYWVGTLNGVVFRYSGSDMTAADRVTLSGDRLTSVGGCTSDGHGGMYATDQLPGLGGPHGSVVHIDASGFVTTVASGLDAPSGVALSRDGHTLYFTTGSVSSVSGTLMRVSV